MSVQEAASRTRGFKPKKSVALSGTAAGNTAVCTVGQSGNDLHYRGYDIADLAAHCEFAEVAHLLIYGKLPTAAELAAYKKRLLGLRALPSRSSMPSSNSRPAHPMDVLRTGVSVLGCVQPEADDHNAAGARDIADAAPRFARLRCSSTGITSRAMAGASRSTPTANRRRALPAPAALQAAQRGVDPRHAGLADSLRRARVQRLDFHRARDCRNRLRSVLLHYRRHRRAQRAQARRRQ